MKGINYHLENNPWGMLVFIIVSLLICLSVVMVFIPKKHQGYYIYSGAMGEIPTFRVVNNWRYWPDSYLYTSTNIEETLAVYDKLNRGHNETD